MRVVGIDPGIAICGWAAVEEKKGKVAIVQFDSITTSSNMSVGERLLHLHSELQQILASLKPDVVALESLFFNTNAKTALVVGQARGVVLLAAAQIRIPIVEYTPLQVKMSLTGYGRADKGQIQQMVKQILKLPEIIKQDDVADAAAIALTHCFSYRLQQFKNQNAKIKMTD